jgi:stage II sporulation protein D
VLRSVALLVSALLAASSSASSASVDDALRSLAARSGQTEPLFRIGLDPAHRSIVSATGSFRVVDPASGAPIWKDGYDGELAIVADGGPEQSPSPLYRIQVAAFGSAAAAEGERAKLASTYGVEGVVRYVPDRGSWRVRLGKASDRAALLPLLARLRAAGLTGLWITEEPSTDARGVRIRLVDRSYDSFATDKTRIAVVPGPGGRVRVEGKPYRGIVEARLTSAGTIRAVNWVGLEDYLLGVVPAEMGPEVWPRIEALKAQAVAARTYAWRNRGQFDDDGFDLCATPRCQAYEGAQAEHPMSDRAVAATRGEILTWEGKPISALYTATCGGHTENAADVFPEEDAPYLRGVPCRAEGEALERTRVLLPGRRFAPVIGENGDDVTRDAALLAASRVLSTWPDAGFFRKDLDAKLLRSWTEALARLSGRPAPKGAPGGVATLAEACASLARDLGWDERSRVLLPDEDARALLRDPAAEKLPLEARGALAYLSSIGAVRPFPDGTLHADRSSSRARILPALARVGEVYDAFGLRDATFLGGSSGRVRLAQGKGDLELPVDSGAFLFGCSGARTVPAATLELRSGDRVRFRRGPSGSVDFLELKPPVKGASDDRMASTYAWEVRKSREELETTINRKLEIGTLLDLQVVRRGVSGRIAELTVVGSAGTAKASGFDIRSLLDLKESLVVIELQRDESGRIDSVVFAGKGWGHGVGLCQGGAYGMALRGEDYRKILTHYYSGVAIARIP